MIIFLDMDGVIANFTKGVCDKLKVPIPADTELKYDWVADIVGKNKFYATTYSTAFWANLEKYPWADRLVDFVDKASDGNWFFLSTPMTNSYCYGGKYDWILKHYPKHKKKLILMPGKKYILCRDPSYLLIDDKKDTIIGWQDAGGLTYRWPEYSKDIDPLIINEHFYNLDKFVQVAAQ